MLQKFNPLYRNRLGSTKNLYTGLLHPVGNGPTEIAPSKINKKTKTDLYTSHDFERDYSKILIIFDISDIEQFMKIFFFFLNIPNEASRKNNCCLLYISFYTGSHQYHEIRNHSLDPMDHIGNAICFFPYMNRYLKLHGERAITLINI